MNLGNRMPVWKSQDAIRRQWLHSLCAVNSLYAVFTLVGRNDGAAQVLLRQIIPFAAWFWPLMLLVSAVLIWFGFSVEGARGAAALWGALTAAVFWTIGTREALSDAGWILPGFMTWLHILVVHEVGSGLDEDRERRQRRP